MSQRMPLQVHVLAKRAHGSRKRASIGFVSRIIAVSAGIITAINGQQTSLAQSSGGPLDATKVPSIVPELATAESILQFNGKTWKPSDNVIFMGRFEKFLNTPEEKGESEQEHRKILNQIIALLDPSVLKAGTLSEAFRLLARASTFPGDSRLCDTLASAIYGVWQSKRNQIILGEANRILDEEVEKKRRSTSISAAEKVVENKAKITANGARSALSELQAKIDFQGILIQLFMQRRFHHVAIGTRFYRAIFSDGDSRLNIDKTAQEFISKGSGSPPTVATIESLGNEAMRDVQLSTQAFHRLYEKGELQSATERLRDALMIGEYMPELRTVPLQRKRDILHFLQKVQKLESSLETRNFNRAEEVLNGPDGLTQIAKDFDGTRAQAVIDTAKSAARLQLAKARAAANSGDTNKFEICIQQAAVIWPTNPELSSVAEAAFKTSDIAHQTLLELDQLIAHKNFSRIGREAGRFLAAAQSASPERREKLLEILEQSKSIEASIIRAQEYSKKGDYPAAWESLDQPARLFPDELEISLLRSEYAVKAPAFVGAIENGRKNEARSQLAVSLSWYLKAQRLNPGSEIAQQAQGRIAPKLLQELQTSSGAPL